MSVLSLLARRARVQALRELLIGGSVHFYAWPLPSSPQDAPTSAPLASVLLPALPMHATLAQFALASVATAQATDSGTLYWARFADSAGAAVLDALVGLPGSGKEIIATNNQPSPALEVYVGGEVRLVAWQVSEP